MGTFKGPFTANGAVVGGFYGGDGYLAGTVRGDAIEAPRDAQRVADALNLAEGLSVELSALKHERGGEYTVADPNDSDLAAFGVYIRNPLAFHVRDFRIDNETGGYGPAADAKAAAFKYADGLADHLGCRVESMVDRNAPSAEEQALTVLRTHGFEIEGGGAAIAIMSHYLPNGALVYASDGDGGGLPEIGNFMVCVYATVKADGEHTEALLTFRHDDDDSTGLDDAAALAMRAARTIDSALRFRSFPREAND